MWGGRFAEGSEKLFREINYSIQVDRRLAVEDLEGSIAYASSLKEANLISEIELTQLTEGLSMIKNEWTSKKFSIKPEDEDVHTANERRLIELIGDTGKKLHTGRSRNDQVVTDMRLWLKKAVVTVLEKLKKLVDSILLISKRDIEIIFPGYTHLQRAQPIRWSHWNLQFAWNLIDDIERFIQILRRIDRNPLGSGALSGNPFGIDREKLCSSLGFSSNLENSLFAVSDRDFILEFLWTSSLFSNHLSRWAEDLIIYSSSEFGFVKCSDKFSSGSSLMPQKKNPDALELLRGKSGKIFGLLTSLFISIKGLPSTYNKDLQDDKASLFETFDIMILCLEVADGVINTLKVFPEKMKLAITKDMFATELADYLVKKGVPFRESHHISGKCILFSESALKNLDDLTLKEFQNIDARIGADIFAIFNEVEAVESRNSIGGTSRSSVFAQIASIKSKLLKFYFCS
eukprot:NODE_101_length_19951_cov_0.932501.p4 type:complete len:460 gc:universal NODE_101_length_19951_cov_0.932501:16984-15605(-)